MLDELISICNNTDYDFRDYSFPGDELSYLFNEWVDYYRMKYAITKMIQPKSILEIGIGYGYSAITFLKASENATYLGIYNDSDTFSVDKGAVNWAKKITKNYDAGFLLVNSQSKTTLPGDFYDLIHIDGHQDGDGIFNDLELAMEKGRWILVDCHFLSNENLLSATYFLNKYRDFIEFALTIPSYTGELLIKLKDSARHIFTKYTDKNYSSLKGTYDPYYFLSDCGGYDSFKKFHGRKLEDPRLIAVCCLVNPHNSMEILDVGCGRGELSYALSQSEAQVTGIDYSLSAIQIAKATYLNSTVSNLKFIQDDFLSHKFNKKFDRIIAADFVEHIEEEKLELMIKKIKDILKDDGLFIIHTFPNKLYYQFFYEEKREIAKSIGVYIPQNPRTFYEDLMHINEQTPQSLSLLLNKYFPQLLTWVTNYPDFSGSLTRPFSHEECNNSRTILAVSSLKNLDKDLIIQLLSSKKLDRDGIDVEVLSEQESVNIYSNQKFKLSVILRNNGKERLVSLPPNSVHISYHWLKNDGTYEIFDGFRTDIIPALNPQEQRDFQVEVVAPQERGEYQLQLDLVQEGCFWFEEITNKYLLNINSKVEQNPDECRSEESEVDTFEIKDEEINVEEIMEKIRQSIKERKESDIYKNESATKIEHVFSEVSCSRERNSQEFGIINSNLDIRNNNYSISSHRSMLGKFLIKGRTLVNGEVRRYVDPLFQKQSELNYNIADFLKEITERVNSCSNEIKQLKSEVEELECENRTLKFKIEQLKPEVEELECENRTLKFKIEQLNSETKELKIESEKLKTDIVSNVKKEVESLISSINLDLDNKAWLSRILESRIQKGCKNQVIDSSGNVDSDINYYLFEERFRGSRENILRHQTDFIDYFANCINVLDIGCGRGEFLELAKDKGINAWGIDVDEDMINFCKFKGLDVELKDAIEALEELEDESLDGIFISQVVEHLSPDYLIKMLNLCNRKMRSGFYIIIETVNILSLFSFANFYIDLSHVKPVHPETLRFLLNTVGFRDIETKFSSPVPSEMKLQKLPDPDGMTEKSKTAIRICNQNIDMINDALYGAQDYAIIGQK